MEKGRRPTTRGAQRGYYSEIIGSEASQKIGVRKRLYALWTIKLAMVCSRNPHYVPSRLARLNQLYCSSESR